MIIGLQSNTSTHRRNRHPRPNLSPKRILGFLIRNAGRHEKSTIKDLNQNIKNDD